MNVCLNVIPNVDIDLGLVPRLSGYILGFLQHLVIIPHCLYSLSHKLQIDLLVEVSLLSLRSNSPALKYRTSRSDEDVSLVAWILVFSDLNFRSSDRWRPETILIRVCN